MSHQLFDLTGNVALVTGCNTGIGQAIAIGLASAGADIAGVFCHSDQPQTQKQVEKLGRRFIGINADLADPSAQDRIISMTTQHLGRLDILVNNAGITRRCAAIDFSQKDWDDVMDINAKALFFLSQAATRTFLRQKSRGKIINIASLLSFQGGIRVASYTASKSAVLGITHILANEWAGQGINVNAIAPGYVATDMTRSLREDPKRNSALLDRIPAGRWGTPEDLQGAAIFLGSRASDYVHGQTIAVDGGWLSR